MLYTCKYALFLYVKQHKFLGKKMSTETNQVPEKKNSKIQVLQVAQPQII